MNNPFIALGLPESLAKTVAGMGYETPTPVQVQAIPELLAGHDVLAAAQTGTGKTAAFSLPIITKMLQTPKKRTAKKTRALILAPTRELAAQIDENIRAYAKGTGLNTALVFGGVNIKPQTAVLERGVDFLVATPGRLLDHLGQKNISLETVEFLVLDEADRMLDMGFIHDIRKVLKFLPEKRQTLLFSATFSNEIRELASSLLTNPVSVEIARNQESTLIEQEAWSIAKKRKRELLRDLIVDNNWEQVLVFTRMKHTANRLAQQLEKDGIVAAAIHGNKSQSARTKALSGFKDHSIRVLVATDIAARGLDIEGLPHVVNYELPNVPEDYVHRIGRTGRAGIPGHAVSLVSTDDAPLLKDIERLLKRKIAIQKAVGYDGEIPEDIARDDAERDKARAEELRKMREARKKARNGESKEKNKTTRPKANKAEAEPTSSDSADRFEKKIVRKRHTVITSSSRSEATEPVSGRPNRSRSNPRSQSENNAPHQNSRNDRDSVSHRGKKSFAGRHREPDIVSTVVSTQKRRYSEDTKRKSDQDSRFESVSSNLPPGMILKFRRR